MPEGRQPHAVTRVLRLASPFASYVSRLPSSSSIKTPLASSTAPRGEHGQHERFCWTDRQPRSGARPKPAPPSTPNGYKARQRLDRGLRFAPAGACAPPTARFLSRLRRCLFGGKDFSHSRKTCYWKGPYQKGCIAYPRREHSVVRKKDTFIMKWLWLIYGTSDSHCRICDK